VSGKYSAPALLNDKLGLKNYRNVYLDLFGASIPGTKVFVEDLGANGLQLGQGVANRCSQTGSSAVRTLVAVNPVSACHILKKLRMRRPAPAGGQT